MYRETELCCTICIHNIERKRLNDETIHSKYLSRKRMELQYVDISLNIYVFGRKREESLEKDGENLRKRLILSIYQINENA